MQGIEDIEIFKKRSFLHYPLQLILAPIIRYLAKDKKSFSEQYEQITRNVEIVAESTLDMLFSIKGLRAASLLRPISDWVIDYSATQKHIEKQKQFLIYTEEDHKIPFRADYDTLYVYAVTQILYLANFAAGIKKGKDMRKISKLCRDLNFEGDRVFKALPTKVLRNYDHNRVALDVVQWIDQPLNCCPSLHIGYAVLINNIGQNLLNLRKRRPKDWDDTEKATKRTIDAVLYVKQHAIVDVAAGMLAAEIAYRKNYPMEGFEDFTKYLREMEEENKEVPYTLIGKLHTRMKKHYERYGSLEASLRQIFKEEKYPYVRAQEADLKYLQLCAKWNLTP